jgi:hypothetical protein
VTRTVICPRFEGRRALGLGLLVVLVGCGSSGTAADAGPPDACVGATGCSEVCELGNSWGVGRYCTPGGGQCADTPDRRAPYCTADFDPGGPWFCTRPCADATQCGEAAVCTNGGAGGPRGCVPDVCYYYDGS